MRARAAETRRQKEVGLLSGVTRIVGLGSADAAPVPRPIPSNEPPATREQAGSTTAPPPTREASTNTAVERRAESSPTVLVLTMAAVAAAAGGTGAWFLEAARADESRAGRIRRNANQNGATCYGRNNGPCSEADDLATRGSSERTAAVGLLAGGGALAVGALLTFLAWPRGAQAVRLSGSAAPGSAFAAAIVRF
jgi:hypothetical protein